MKVNLDGKTMQGASAFVMFITLNVVFLVTCIPIVTIGMATSALFEVTMRYSDEESGHLLKDYFVALKSNAGRASVVYLCFIVPTLLLAFAGFFWLFQGSAISIAVAVIAFLGAVYLFAAFLYGMALVARYRATLRQTLKNALLLPAAEPWRTFVLVVIPATLVSLTAAFSPFLIVMLSVGFSVSAYAVSFLLRGVFARH